MPSLENIKKIVGERFFADSSREEP